MKLALLAIVYLFKVNAETKCPLGYTEDGPECTGIQSSIFFLFYLA